MLREPQGKEYVSALFSPCAVFILLSIDYKFDPSNEPAPNDDDEARKREEEELQRALELSVQDKGGRRNWNEYSLASSSSAGGSSSQTNIQTSTARPPAAAAAAAAPSSSSSSTPAPAYHQNAYSTGFVPSTETHLQTTAPPAVESSPQSTSTAPTSPTSSTTDGYAVTRVRALHGFEPTEPNELAFEKGDVIKVVNREYKDWWRGQLRGRTGIFPVNYVVRLHAPLPLPSLMLTF
jgi:signal transducing adaptor molecule